VLRNENKTQDIELIVGGGGGGVGVGWHSSGYQQQKAI
jgi:hypothetical protein